MRVCPICQSRFVGGETFCPHDGNKLVDARELSPGELTGSKLGDVVRLDKLAYADPFAERYTGRLLESRRAVYVTVFNQKFKVDAATTKRVETARAKVGSPMPPQINTLLQVHFDRELPFLVESEPRGPSVRTLLDEKRTLAWDEAVRITANLARAMQWLHEQGVPHCSFHPTSIFVTKLQEGQVVVGDWALEALFPPDSAERIVEEDPSAFAGYVDYMAPEIARATEKADIRSAVYALGCVLYEMVAGKVPLPGKSAAEVLKRHQHEKPVRLSIAVGGGDLPPQLDDILEMMLAKDPDKRFQSPAAAVAALSNLVNESPVTLAPPLERAGETDVDDLYRTIDMDSVDRDALEPRRSVASNPMTTLAAPRPGPQAPISSGGPVSGVSATADVDETSPDDPPTGTKRSTEQFKKRSALGTDDQTDEAFEPDAATRPTARLEPNMVAAAAASPDGGEDAGDSKRTLMMGAMSALTAPSEADDDDGRTKTLLEFNPPGGVPLAAKVGRREKKKKQLAKYPPPNGAAAPRPTADVSPTDKTIRLNIEEAVAAADRGGLAEVSEPAPKPVIALDAAAAAEAGLGAKAPEIGFVTPKPSIDATRDLDRSTWFGGNADDVWEKSLAQEAQEHSDRRNKTIGFVIAGALVVAAIGLIAYFEFSGEPVAEVKPAAVAVVVPPKPAVNLDEIKAAFDEALEANRIVEPFGNSSLTHLESLKRHGATDPLYEQARTTFVSTARDAAKAADKAGDLRSARSLAGYASQFAPEDSELSALTADLQARFTGVTATPDAGTPDAGAPDLGAGAEVEPDEPPDQPDPKPVASKTKKREPRPPKVTAPKKWDTGDADALARDARAAHTSGNLDQAKKLYAQALEIDGRNTTALAGLGKVHFDKADYRDAVKYQTKAVSAAPKRNDYRISLGQSYYRLGKYEEAVVVWEKVLERDPNNSTARQYVELAKRKLGR